MQQVLHGSHDISIAKLARAITKGYGTVDCGMRVPLLKTVLYGKASGQVKISSIQPLSHFLFLVLSLAPYATTGHLKIVSSIA